MFKYLDYIYEVYKSQSFSRAAENLFISQSSLSLTIKHAEQQIGAEIFNRKTKPLSLTEFGQKYIEACEQILLLSSELENYIYDINHLCKGTIRIGAGNFLATYLVAPLIGQFKKKYPNININLVEGRSADLSSHLEKGDLDLLVTNAELKSKAFEKQKLFSEHLLMTIPIKMISCANFNSQPLSMEDILSRNYGNNSYIDLSRMNGIPFIGLRPGNDTRIRTDLLYKEQNLSPTYFMEMDQSSTVFIIASNQAGACIVADTVIRTLWRDQQIAIYDIKSSYANREVAVYSKISKCKTAVLQSFIDLLLEKAQDIL